MRVLYGTDHKTCKSEELNSAVWSSQFPTLISAIHAEIPSNYLGNFVWDLVSTYLGRATMLEVVPKSSGSVQGKTAVTKGLLAKESDWPFTVDVAYGAILPNLRWLPDSVITYSVEIKPKCGFVSHSPLIHPDNSMKRRFCRYQLHQHLKLQQVRYERRHAATASP